MRWWKWVGLGALATVAVAGTGAVVVRQRRSWVETEDAEIADRLRQRLADLRSTD